jgi:hypothetical protein
LEDTKGTDHPRDLGIDGRITLKQNVSETVMPVGSQQTSKIAGSQVQIITGSYIPVSHDAFFLYSGVTYLSGFHSSFVFEVSRV